MKILYIITKSEAGGAQTHVAELCKYFSNKGNTVGVLSYPGGWLQTEVEKMGIKFFANNYFSNSLNPVRIIKAYLETKKVIKEFKPDLVHCHSSAAGAYGRLAVRNKIRTLYTAHGWGFNIGVPFFQKWIAILIEKYLSGYTSKIICVSDFVKNLGLKFRIAPEDKFVVIKNGVLVKEINPRSIDKKVRIVFVGRLAEPKDPLLLLEAVNKIKDKSLFEVSIVGDGKKRIECENFIKEKHLVNVKIFGELDLLEVDKLLQDSDIFVLISKWEGLPLTILEAMSVGLPVVVSNVGGISEVVNTENGILVENKVDDIEQALVELIQNRGLRLKMGESGYEKVKQSFSLGKMLEELEYIYKNT